MAQLKIKERVKYLDLLKCLGMFIVVQGHIHTHYGWFSLPLHSFVIPLYFFLSGLTFRRSKFPHFSGFIKHRLKTLIFPYVLFSIVTWGVWAAYNYVLINADIDYWGPLFQTIWAQGSGNYLVHNVPLWFVPCLFVIESMYYWIDKLKSQCQIIIVLIVCALIGVWMINGQLSGFFHKLPWSTEGAFVGVIFYGFANLLVKNISLKDIEVTITNKKGASIGGIIVLSVILVFTSYYNEHVSIGSDLLGRNPILFYLNAFMGIISISLFSILISSMTFKSKIVKKIMDYHYWFGRNSFYIMATHVPIKGILIIIVADLINQSKHYVENDYLCCAIVFTLTCALSSIASLIISRMKKNDELLVEKIRARFINANNI